MDTTYHVSSIHIFTFIHGITPCISNFKYLRVDQPFFSLCLLFGIIPIYTECFCDPYFAMCPTEEKKILHLFMK